MDCDDSVRVVEEPESDEKCQWHAEKMDKTGGLCRLCANECEKGTSLMQQTSNGDSILEIVNKYLHLKVR